MSSEADAPTDAEAPAAAEGDAAPEPEPVDEAREAMVAALREALGDAVLEHHVRAGDDVWVRVDRAAWREVAEVARDRLGCTYFSFLSAIDWLPSPFGRDMDAVEDAEEARTETFGEGPQGITIDVSEPDGGWDTGIAGGTTRFQLLARLEKPGEDAGITLKADLPDGDLVAPTWSDLFAGADWHEREAWEMFGIAFTGHPGLSHIYLPGEFEGNPLRKDFPLLARRVKPWPGIVDVEPMPGEDDETPEAAAGDAVESSADAGGDA